MSLARIKNWLAVLDKSPGLLSTLESEVHRRMYWFGIIFAALIAPINLTTIALFDGHPKAWLSMGAIYLTFAISIAVALKKKKYLWALRIFHGGAFVGTLIPCLTNISVNTPAFWWLSTIPAVMLLCGLNFMGLSMSALVVCYALFAYAHPELAREVQDSSLRVHLAVALSTIYVSAYLGLAMGWRRKLKLALVAAQEQAVASAADKARFLLSMSHEIRTPLYGVIGAVELLRAGKATPAQRNQLLAMQEQSAKTLLALINDVLDWSKLEAGRVELAREVQDLRAIVFEANELYAVTAFEKGLEFTSSCDPDVPRALLGDGMRIRQIVHNLVNNAVKFTKRGSVHIHAALALEEVPPAGVGQNDGLCWVRIDVSDTGIGIPPSNLQALLAPFTQAEGVLPRKFGGTGLGLSICRELAELMGGRISVRSAPNNGSTFSLIFPTTLVPTEPKTTSQPYRNDVLIACSSAGLVRHVLALAYEIGASPEVVSHLPDEDELLGYRYILVDAPLLAGHGRPKDWVDNLTKQGLKVAVMTPLNTDAMVGTFAEGVLYKPVSPLALGTFLRKETSAQHERLPNLRAEADLVGLRVLVCEDNPVNQIIVQQMLEEVGATFVLVPNGVEALKELQANSYDLVLMDVAMPGLDGMETTRRWRAIEKQRQLRKMVIIAMTAKTESGHGAAAREAGMDGFLAKPFVFKELERKLKAHARAARA